MMSTSTCERSRRFILGISQDLSSEDARGLRFLVDFPSAAIGGCCCHQSNGSLELLERMQRSKVFGWNDLAPLVDLLREIHREDLATKCEQFQLQLPSSKELSKEQHPSLHTSPPSASPPSFRASSPSLQASPSPPFLHDSWEEVNLPPTTLTSLHTPLLRRANPLSRSTSKLRQFVGRKLCKSHRTNTGSHDEGLDSFHHIHHTDVLDRPAHAPAAFGTSQSFDSTLPPQPAMSPVSLRGRSWTTDSRDSGISVSSPVGTSPTHPCGHTPFKGAYTTDSWKLNRVEDFMTPVIKHDNKAFERKFQVKVGTGTKFILTFVLKLYPNGVNWDQDSSASLHVEVKTSLSSHVNTKVYFGVRVVEDRTTSRDILAERRRICCLKEEREFLLDEFLSHEVVKTSQAKLLYMLFHVEMSYQLGEDWVCVETEQALGQLQDRNLCST